MCEPPDCRCLLSANAGIADDFCLYALQGLHSDEIRTMPKYPPLAEI